MKEFDRGTLFKDAIDGLLHSPRQLISQAESSATLLGHGYNLNPNNKNYPPHPDTPTNVPQGGPPRATSSAGQDRLDRDDADG